MISEPDGGRPVVLAVEDDLMLLMDAVMSLEEAGFVVIGAQDADCAIQILESRADIEIVFTDIEMPGSMDGMRLAAVIRDRWPPVHLLVASGRLAPQADKLPADAQFFSKPYDVVAIGAAMRALARTGLIH